MFTGLIEETGTVETVRCGERYRHLEIRAERVLAGTVPGDSIAIDGACQTVVALGEESFTVETLAVSLDKTTLGDYSSGRRVNLERAVTPHSRLGGHFVQGHVDGTARVVQIRKEGPNGYITVKLPPELRPYCVDEGSIAIDGVSLTIAELNDTRVTVNVIPVTWRQTVLRERVAGSRVNIEVDIIGRYVARMLGVANTRGTGTITRAKLAEWGYPS